MKERAILKEFGEIVLYEAQVLHKCWTGGWKGKGWIQSFFQGRWLLFYCFNSVLSDDLFRPGLCHF